MLDLRQHDEDRQEEPYERPSCNRSEDRRGCADEADENEPVLHRQCRRVGRVDETEHHRVERRDEEWIAWGRQGPEEAFVEPTEAGECCRLRDPEVPGG